MKGTNSFPFVAAPISVLAGLCFASVALATPYASGVINSGGTVSFYLNEQAARVQVVFNNGTTTNDLGALPRGRYSFSLGTNNSFRIVVKNDSPAGYATGALLQLSDDSTLFHFNAPRGVAVNRNPASPYFGRIYVADSVAGTTSATSNAVARSLSDGIYALNPDASDALGQGDTPRTGGIAFDTSGTPGNAPAANSPWHIEVGEDDNLYVSDFSSVTGTIWQTDPNVGDGAGKNVFVGIGAADAFADGHGRFGSSAVALGSLTASNLTLYALEGDLGPVNGLRRYDIGAGPLPLDPVAAGNATNLANPLLSIINVTVDMDRAPDGKFFLLQNRSVGSEAGLFVIGTNDVDGDGLLDVVFDSLSATRAIPGMETSADLLRISRAVSVSPDGSRVAIIRDDNNAWIIGLTNGVPDFNSRLLLTNAPNTTLGRDIAFDAAGNLYTVSSGQGLLRVFSPGGISTAITDSDGTFGVIKPDQTVVVSATDDFATESGDTGAFTLTRAGNTARALTVPFTLTGTAINALDYTASAASAFFPPGATGAGVIITPQADSMAEPTETVVLTLVAGETYTVQIPSSATVFISDNNTPEINVGATDTNIYERIPADTGAFTFLRLGATNSELTVNYTMNGTASNGVDYVSLPGTVVIPAGETNATAIVASIDDGLIEGDETVTLTVAAGTGYTIGANRTATVRIQDDDQPAVSSDRILFLDDFETDTSFNWRVTFGANNLMDGAPQDYDATFAYDYGADGIPPAPHSSGGTTRGLKLRVNKNDPTPNGSAGVNLYPSGDVAPIFFSSDYALQFDMYLSYGGVSTTEHALCGLNHSGTLTNRVTQSPDPNNSTAGGDGIWAAMVTDASDLIDYGIYAVTNSTSLPTLLVERSASTLAGVFSTPPFGAAGSPANNADASGPRIWVEVELKQVGDTVRLTIDNTQILQVTNPTSFTNGVIMLGMNDQFNSIGSDNNYVIFDNVRVIGPGPAGPAPPNITGAQLAGGNVQIDFAGAGNDAASAFAVESSPEVATGYATETGATVQQTGPGSFRAVLPVNGPIRFYRIRR